MPFNIESFKSALTFGGARNTQFQLQFVNPSTSQADIKVPVLCRAASLPGFRLGTIQVGYFGRMIKLAGDRTFDPWTVTVINDEDFLIRDALESWNTQINTLQGNINNFGGPEPANYKSDAIVTQYGKTGNIIRQYTMIGIWPSQISPITLDWNAVDQIEEFNVTFMVDDLVVMPGVTGNAGGNV